jgi:hypothetical protein
MRPRVESIPVRIDLRMEEAINEDSWGPNEVTNGAGIEVKTRSCQDILLVSYGAGKQRLGKVETTLLKIESRRRKEIRENRTNDLVRLSSENRCHIEDVERCCW